MFPIRRRWPILTGLFALIVYIANHYHIAGLEHLKLKPNSQASAGSLRRIPSLDAGPGEYPSSAHDVYGHVGPGHSASYTGTTTAAEQPAVADVRWPGALSESERFALLGNKELQQRLSGSSQTPATSSTRGVPSVAPIPVPVDFAHMPAELPSTSNALPKSLSVKGGEQFVTVKPSAAPPAAKKSTPFQAGVSNIGSPANGRVRIASFNVESLGPAKLAKPHVMTLLVSMLRQYDVIALQEIRSTRDDILPMLVERLNQSGRQYDYMIGPRVGREAFEQFGFIFDTQRLETDRYRLYTVDDPSDLIAHEPLVAWFRCKRPAEKDAFTFSLVNVRVDPKNAGAERAIIPDIVTAVERDGRNEDDWIMLGDFSGDTAGLAFMQRSGVRFAVQDIPTEISGTRMLDSVFFSQHATTEYSGRAGALDFLRKYNLTIEQAQEVSNHMPVWAEFYDVEGGLAGAIAPGLSPSASQPQGVF